MMEQIVWDKGGRFHILSKSMGNIGWRRYTEDIISKEVLDIQAEYNVADAGPLTTENWAKGLTIKLLKITHGQ